MSSIEQILARTAGLDALTLGPGAVNAAVQERMAVLGLTDVADYRRRVADSETELQSLVEAVVVPETWFFRDQRPFAYLAEFAAKQWRPAHSGKPMRVMSVPCSSGEEPYSIAMALMLSNMPPGQYRIDAFDISRALLKTAEGGAYRQRSFRVLPTEVRDRFFQPEGSEYVVRPEVRTGITFARGNVVDPAFPLDKPCYDVIFCRNLLIYQHAEARAKTIAALDSLLREGGMLFVGHAEMNAALSRRFTPVSDGGAFAYRKTDGPASRAADDPPQVSGNASGISAAGEKNEARGRHRAKPERRHSSLSPAPHHPKGRRSSAEASPANGNLLARAQAFADLGRLDEAAALCEQRIKAHPKDVSACFLLGVLSEAAGNPQKAEEWFNRVLYLDAGHHDALLHLSLLLSSRGDTTAAGLLRQRAERVRQKGGPLS